MPGPQPVGHVSKITAVIFGIFGFVVSAAAFLVLGYSLSLVVAAGNMADPGIDPLLYPVIIATICISVANMANAMQFMAQRIWRPFVRFLLLSVLALILLFLFGMTASA